MQLTSGAKNQSAQMLPSFGCYFIKVHGHFKVANLEAPPLVKHQDVGSLDVQVQDVVLVEEIQDQKEVEQCLVSVGSLV